MLKILVSIPGLVQVMPILPGNSVSELETDRQHVCHLCPPTWHEGLPRGTGCREWGDRRCFVIRLQTHQHPLRAMARAAGSIARASGPHLAQQPRHSKPRSKCGGSIPLLGSSAGQGRCPEAEALGEVSVT